MTTATFSYFDYSSNAELLDLVKRFAKQAKASDPGAHQLSYHHDKVAISLGFNNWSLLHKHVMGMNWSARSDFRSLVGGKPVLGQFMYDHAMKTIVVEDAIKTMKDWARQKYMQLANFAYLDNESENGFSWPSVDMDDELIDEFIGDFPEDLIRQVGYDLDGEEGPWGRPGAYDT